MKRKNITTEMMKDYMVDALILLLRKQPYQSITVGQIAAKAGVNRSTYYRNFQSKEDIIKRYYCRILEQGLSRIENPDTIGMEPYLIQMFQTFYACSRTRPRSCAMSRK